MTTVTLTKIRSGFDNVPANFLVGDHNDETSSLVTAAAYVLPEGYSVGRNSLDEEMIFAPNGWGCEIVEHTSGKPQLVSGDLHSMPVLAEVTD